jgi:hypothetical protein
MFEFEWNSNRTLGFDSIQMLRHWLRIQSKGLNYRDVKLILSVSLYISILAYNVLNLKKWIQSSVLPGRGRRLWLLVIPQSYRVVASPSLWRRTQAPGHPITAHVAPRRSTNSRWAATPSAVLAPSLGWQSVDHARVEINHRNFAEDDPKQLPSSAAAGRQAPRCRFTGGCLARHRVGHSTPPDVAPSVTPAMIFCNPHRRRSRIKQATGETVTGYNGPLPRPRWVVTTHWRTDQWPGRLAGRTGYRATRPFAGLDGRPLQATRPHRPPSRWAVGQVGW